MKKLSKYIIILCAIGSIAWSGLIEGRKQTGADLVTGGAFTQVAGAAVTQANMRLSAVNGTAFIDFSLADLLTDHLGKILTVKDSAGKVLVGYIKAAGTGETYGAEITPVGSAWTGANGATPPDNWAATTAGLWDIVDEGSGSPFDVALRMAVNAVPTTNPRIHSLGLSAPIPKAAYISKRWIKQGTAASIRCYIGSTDGANDYVSYIHTDAAWTEYIYRFTAKTNLLSTDFMLASSTDGQTGYIDEVSTKQVLTPASTGVTIVSTPGGATYNWMYQEVGFNYNDASNYTYEIYDTDFEYGTGWYPSSNTAVKVAGTASAIEQNVSAVVGVGYQVVWTNDQSTTGKSINAEIGGVEGAAVTADATTTNEITMVTASSSGSVTLANMKLSAVDGTAFVDFSAADILTGYIGNSLTLKDSAGKVLVGYIKAAGSGETLSAELITGWTNLGFETLTVNANGHDLDSVINSSGIGEARSNSLAARGALVKINRVNTGTGVGSWWSPFDVINFGSGNLTNNYKTANHASGNGYINLYTNAACNFSVTMSCVQVLTPSATGVTIVSTPGGSTYNWTYQEAGFNYNDASGYTYEIGNLKIKAAADWAGVIGPIEARRIYY